MNLFFLDTGMAGVLEASLIALVAGLAAYGLVHGLLGRRVAWTDAHEIGWSWLGAAAVAAGADIWHLFYMSVIPMQSPVTIERVLDAIHDPENLGTRVFAELAAVSAGVMLGWWLAGLHRARRAPDQDRE